jgi:hypothetical protein
VREAGGAEGPEPGDAAADANSGAWSEPASVLLGGGEEGAGAGADSVGGEEDLALVGDSPPDWRVAEETPSSTVTLGSEEDMLGGVVGWTV